MFCDVVTAVIVAPCIAFLQTNGVFLETHYGK